jgi:hypothetical protein
MGTLADRLTIYAYPDVSLIRFQDFVRVVCFNGRRKMWSRAIWGTDEVPAFGAENLLAVRLQDRMVIMWRAAGKLCIALAGPRGISGQWALPLPDHVADRTLRIYALPWTQNELLVLFAGGSTFAEGILQFPGLSDSAQ